MRGAGLESTVGDSWPPRPPKHSYGAVPRHRGPWEPELEPRLLVGLTLAIEHEQHHKHCGHAQRTSAARETLFHVCPR
jgi:hypothetical protein